MNSADAFIGRGFLGWLFFSQGDIFFSIKVKINP
jgi:hypothetical protein